MGKSSWLIKNFNFKVPNTLALRTGNTRLKLGGKRAIIWFPT